MLLNGYKYYLTITNNISIKSNVHKLPTTKYNCWQLLATIGNKSQLMSVEATPLSVQADNKLQLLTTNYNYRQKITSMKTCRQLLATKYNFRKYYHLQKLTIE